MSEPEYSVIASDEASGSSRGFVVGSESLRAIAFGDSCLSAQGDARVDVHAYRLDNHTRRGQVTRSQASTLATTYLSRPFHPRKMR